MRSYATRSRIAPYKVTLQISDGKLIYAVVGPDCRRIFSGRGARRQANDLALQHNAKVVSL